MILVILCLGAWALLLHLCDGSILLALALHLGSVVALAVGASFGCHYFRSSRLAWAVGSILMRVSIDDTSLARLRALDAAKQHFFVCEPHGQAPLHLSFLFAAHGNAYLAPEIAANTVVIRRRPSVR